MDVVFQPGIFCLESIHVDFQSLVMKHDLLEIELAAGLQIHFADQLRQFDISTRSQLPTVGRAVPNGHPPAGGDFAWVQM